jgi:hypothetical protein
MNGANRIPNPEALFLRSMPSVGGILHGLPSRMGMRKVIHYSGCAYHLSNTINFHSQQNEYGYGMVVERRSSFDRPKLNLCNWYQLIKQKKIHY